MCVCVCRGCVCGLPFIVRARFFESASTLYRMVFVFCFCFFNAAQSSPCPLHVPTLSPPCPLHVSSLSPPCHLYVPSLSPLHVSSMSPASTLWSSFFHTAPRSSFPSCTVNTYLTWAASPGSTAQARSCEELRIIPHKNKTGQLEHYAPECYTGSLPAALKILHLISSLYYTEF